MKQLKEIAQAILNNSLVVRAQTLLLWVGSRNRVFALIYSVVFFIPFAREQHAVLRGKYEYRRNEYRSMRTKVELRRSIHRLEKGLSSRERRDNFGKNIVPQAMIQYELALNNRNQRDESEIQWAHDVLAQYFSVVDDSDNSINQLRKKFSEMQPLKTDRKKHPFSAKERSDSDITYDQLLDLAMRRRSVRWFTDKKVEREKIDKALLVGRQSPSACNRLPYEIRFFDEPEHVRKVANLPFGASGYADNIPTIAVVVGKLDSYFSSRDRHAVYVDASLAVMPFLLALETLDLSSCVINWPDFEPLEIKMQKLLNLDTSERPIMLIAVGYADPEGMIPYSQKKELDTIRRYNFE